jgi:hypothetical protein
VCDLLERKTDNAKYRLAQTLHRTLQFLSRKLPDEIVENESDTMEQIMAKAACNCTRGRADDVPRRNLYLGCMSREILDLWIPIELLELINMLD